MELLLLLMLMLRCPQVCLFVGINIRLLVQRWQDIVPVGQRLLIFVETGVDGICPFLGLVSSAMLSQVVRARECLGAVRADVGTFLCMCSDVTELFIS